MKRSLKKTNPHIIIPSLLILVFLGLPMGQAMGIFPSDGWTDGRIEGAIERRLEMDSRIHEDKVGAKVEGGQVILFGEVESLEEKGIAGQIAMSVNGVHSLVNDLDVPPNVSQDQAIKNSIEQKFRSAQLLHDNNVNIDVNNQMVTLKGTILSRNDKQSAVRLAESVKGVRKVKNLLQVVGKQRPDEEIHKDVVQYLIWSPLFNAEDFTVTVDEGVVNLKGTIDLLVQRDVLMIDIGNINGVDMVEVGKVIPENLLADSASKVK